MHVVDFGADARESRTTYVISVDDRDLEVAPRAPSDGRSSTCESISAQPQRARKLIRDGVGWPTAGLQGEDFHAFLLRPLPQFKGGVAAARHAG